jgi:hypothetical protein
MRKNSTLESTARVMKEMGEFGKKNPIQMNAEEVMEFLIFKDTNESGRTVVHGAECEFIGSNEARFCRDKRKCGRRHAYDSLRSNVVEKIKKGFRDEGIMKDWDPQSGTGNPAISREVSSYLKFVKEEQGKAGVVPKQAQVFLKEKLHLLLQEMDKERFSILSSPKRCFEITRDCAVFSVTFGAMKRGDCISKFISKKHYEDAKQ